MASVCYFCLLIVTMFIGYIVGAEGSSRNCSKSGDSLIHLSCDECIRCGGRWCYYNMDDVDTQTARCTDAGSDDRCPDIRGPVSLYPETPDHMFFRSGSRDTIVDEQSFNLQFIKSTIKDLDWNKVISKQGAVNLKVEIGQDFCPSQSNPEEYVTVQLEYEAQAPRLLTVAVPCRCKCSTEDVEVESKQCSGRGNYSCNICSCPEGWKGQSCEVKVELTSEPLPPEVPLHPKIPIPLGFKDISEPQSTSGPQLTQDPKVTLRPKDSGDERGDIDNCRNRQTNIICSGNGYCLKGNCVCNDTLVGSQYFNPNSDTPCADICSTISSYADECITTGDLPKDCQTKRYYRHELNKTLLDEVTSRGQKVWIECQETNNGCEIKYVAKRDYKEITHYMILESSCSGVAAQSGLKGGVPIGLGVAAMLAVIAAAAGYMLWKKGEPPAPLNQSGYDCIDPEDSKGLNPLFIPAVSSYNNPMYGKKE